MAIEVVVPRLGWSMDEGVFVEWLKQDGERIHAGDMLFVVEGDKAAEEIESFDSGILQIPAESPQPGDEVRVGQVLAYLLADGESAPTSPQPDLGVANTGQAPADACSSASTDLKAAVPQRTRGSVAVGEPRVAITPRARRLARQRGVTWSNVVGSGRNGRIRERDILALGSGRMTDDESSSLAPSPSGQFEGITRFRQTIATRMLAGTQQAAPVTLTTKADATALVRRREQLRQQALANEASPPSYTDLLVKLSAGLLQRYPSLRAQWSERGLFVPDSIHVAFAVATELGLLAPVIQDVPQRTIAQVTAESQRLIRLARDGQLQSEQLRGACFTVTNLGGFGIDAFTPILHLPQSAILGVGRIVREPVVMADDSIVPREMMTLSLTFDHRVLDGAPAAEFLNAFRLGLTGSELT